MGIYIIRPKGRLLEREFTPFLQVRGRMQPEERVKQIDEIVLERSKDPVRRELRRYIDKSKSVRDLPSDKAATSVTGTSIVEMSEEQAEKMRKELPDVAIIPDLPLELIPPNRVANSATGRLTPAKLWHQKAIGLPTARKKGLTATGVGITVAVLDTGIDASHPEFDGRIGEAYTFDVAAWSPVAMVPSKDTQGHGTHVAGLICGKKVGVAPGAKVLSGVMLPGGRGHLSDFIIALEWAASRPEVQIVNISAGIRGYLPEMHQALADLLAVGVLPVVATGNEGRNKTRSPGNYVEVLSVGSVDHENYVSTFSSSGTIIADNHLYTVPDLVAPGEGVYSCVKAGDYEAWDGTSMATPIVAGIAALVLQAYPTMTVMDLMEEIISGCKDLDEEEVRQGHGLVQAGAAL